MSPFDSPQVQSYLSEDLSQLCRYDSLLRSLTVSSPSPPSSETHLFFSQRSAKLFASLGGAVPSQPDDELEVREDSSTSARSPFLRQRPIDPMQALLRVPLISPEPHAVENLIAPREHRGGKQSLRKRKSSSASGSEKRRSQRSPPKAALPVLAQPSGPEESMTCAPIVNQVCSPVALVVGDSELVPLPQTALQCPLVPPHSLFYFDQGQAAGLHSPEQALVDTTESGVIEFPATPFPLPLALIEAFPDPLVSAPSLHASPPLMSPPKRGALGAQSPKTAKRARLSTNPTDSPTPLFPPPSVTLAPPVQEESDDEWNYFSVLYPSDTLPAKYEHLRRYVGRRFTDLEAPKNDPFKYGCVTDIVQLEGKGPFLFRFYNYLKYPKRVPSLANGDCWAFQGCDELIRDEEGSERRKPIYLWH
jgi:hypothetical protein